MFSISVVACDGSMLRALAGLDSISGHAVPSLAEYFKVSVEAMAIRLEQLDLVPDY